MDLSLFEKESLALDGNPTMLVVFSNPKVGKTSAALQIPNSFMFDFEGGSDEERGMKINLKRYAKEKGCSIKTALSEAIKIWKANNITKDYLIIDSLSALEDLAKEIALEKYKNSIIGKNFQDNDLYNLPKGAGYGLVRESFETLLQVLEALPKKGLVLLGHVKISSMDKDGTELNFTDLDLTGKLKSIICKEASAIGILSRDKKDLNKNIISFKTNPGDIVTGARNKHIAGKEFVLSEMTSNGLKTNWENIYK